MTKRWALGISVLPVALLVLIAAARIYTVPIAYVVDNPAITIAGGTATTTTTATPASREAHLLWVFGTVAGSYGTCTVQAKTSYDGTTWLNLAPAQTVTATTNTVNAWDIYQQAPATSGATASTPSATAGTGFGQLTEYVFACGGGYGTSAPVTITAVYR